MVPRDDLDDDRRHPPRTQHSGQLGLTLGLALLAATAAIELLCSLLRTPTWRTGLDATQAVAVGGVLMVLGRTFRRLRAYQDRVARAQSVLRTYVPGPLAASVLDAQSARHVALHRRPLTVLFADLQDFAGLTERVHPDALTGALEAYFAAAAEAARSFDGTIHKYLGDGVMVLFGLETSIDERTHAVRAVRTALAIQRAVDQLAWVDAEGAAPVALAVRVGVATGVVSVGSIGPQARRDFTAIGPAVNLAARLQGHCRPGRILLDHRTWCLVRDDIPCAPRGEIAMKGLAQAPRVYEAGGASLALML